MGGVGVWATTTTDRALEDGRAMIGFSRWRLRRSFVRERRAWVTQRIMTTMVGGSFGTHNWLCFPFLFYVVFLCFVVKYCTSFWLSLVSKNGVCITYVARTCIPM